jgi:hypothetical protein
MKPSTDNLDQAAVAQQCRALRLPTVADQCASLVEEAIKQRLTYLRYLEALLATELEERERNIPASGSTLLRELRRHGISVPTLGRRVLGIDDWAWRKGHRYGTILCDLEQGKFIDVLPDHQV